MPQCAIKNCKSDLGPNSPYYSYYFPKPEKSPDRFASWCRYTNPSCINNRSSRVCAMHFQLEDFVESDILKIRLTPNLFKKLVPKLKGGVVPSLNLGDEEEDVQNRVLKKVSKKKKTIDTDLRSSTSWKFPACEIKTKEDNCFETMPPRNSVGIQCEFGCEVYRGIECGSETVDK